MFVLNRKCTEQTEHDNYVPGVCFEQKVYGTNSMIIMFLVFVLNRKCTEQTEHDNYVPGVCFEQKVYGTNRA